MKKFSLLLAALLMVLSFGLAGCAEYRPGTKPDGSTGPGQHEKPPATENPPDEEDAFTVTLISGGKPFAPAEEIFAQWTDIDSGRIYRAPFNSFGVAKTTGLSGDFKVTLSALPAGYTYDPNIYVSHDEDRAKEIRLYPITPTTGAGDGLYSPIMLSSTGIYRAAFTYPGQTVYFRYKPTYTGEYSFSTLVDITDNVINPILDVHLGGSGYINPTPSEKIDTGGPENTYTKNLVWTAQLGNVNHILEFGLRVMSMNSNPFPLTVDFILEWEGEFTGGDEEIKREVVVPTEDFVQQTVPAGKTFNYVAYLDPVNHLLDTDMFKLWKKQDGGDGYYHFYDEITGYGDLIYAKINQDNEIMITEKRTGFLDDLVRCYVGNKDYGSFMKAYGNYCNADGVYPVTEELQIFLQGYASGQSIFNDGNSIAEKELGYNAGEHDMWLFACGYYS